MNEHDTRQAMVELGLSLFNRGYATGGSGNLSARLDDGRIIATPTNSCLGRLQAERLSLVDEEGRHLQGDKPTKELSFHLSLYQNDPGKRAVVHLHCTYLTALSCLEGLDSSNVIRPFTPYYVMRVGQLPLIPYYHPGDERIARDLGEQARNYNAFLLANHGPVVTGRDLYHAVDNMEELEETARLALLLSQQQVRYLSEQEVLELSRRKV
ncbi:aldolase [Pokkaliibacter plantistimulans]|uniref:3-oxo-tetronate 4-phosphate decarboxylase n=1 Tax=Pokkaliibacter plantistimulans TaxID=1635171 RepID=A0ABX5LZQ0_9GAMM|nr:aldolase [Pokkaliibacter plantistimulans]PXF31786.1 aldolase [Pokkaliibacter plantistimulans]